MPAAAIWPQGEPEKAIIRHTWIYQQWDMIGPRAIWAALRGKRMCRVSPLRGGDNPVVAARACEKVLRKRRT